MAGIDKEYRRRQQEIKEDAKIWEEGKADYKNTTRTGVFKKIYQENPKYLYLTLAITLINVFMSLWLLPLLPNRIESESALSFFYSIMIIAFIFLYFSGVYHWGRKLLVSEYSGWPRMFLIAAIFVNVCVWPLAIFVKAMP